MKEKHSQEKQALPVFIRPPAVGLEFYTGFSRSKLYQLEAEGKIRGFSMKEPNQKKGTHLFNLQSILDYVESKGTV